MGIRRSEEGRELRERERELGESKRFIAQNGGVRRVIISDREK